MFGRVKIVGGMTNRADRILILSVLAAALAVSVLLAALQRDSGAGAAVIEQDGQEILRLPLQEDASVRISCEGGYNVVTVKSGRVAVTEADCRDQICVNQGEISGSFETIVCLPHRLSVHLEGVDSGAGPDAVTN